MIALFFVMILTPSTGALVEKNSIKLTLDSKTLYVGGSGPGNYTTIKDAVNDANDGDTVFVFNGVYKEGWISVTKSIKIIGEDKEETHIDGSNQISVGFAIYANNISIKGFTIKNFQSGPKKRYFPGGIIVYKNDALIDGNKFVNNENGIWIFTGETVISNNIFINNERTGIYITQGNNNIINKNHFERNLRYGILIENDIYGPRNNRIIKNNFILNGEKDAYFILSGGINYWSRNYWENSDFKPCLIRGTYRIWFFNYQASIEINWFNIDWFPAQEPHDI